MTEQDPLSIEYTNLVPVILIFYILVIVIVVIVAA